MGLEEVLGGVGDNDGALPRVPSILTEPPCVCFLALWNTSPCRIVAL